MGMGKPAARVTDMHTCPMVTVLVPHVGGPILPPCSLNTLIGFLPAARVTDMALCVGPPDMIATGSPTVLINNLMAARMTDKTVHGGVIVMGCFTVLIGDNGRGGAGGMGAGGFFSSLSSALSELFQDLAKLISDLTKPSKTDPTEPPLLSWERLESSIELFSKDLFKPGEKGFAPEFNYELADGSVAEGKNEGKSTFLGIPVKGSAEGKILSYEAGAKVGASKDGASAGAYAEGSVMEGELEGVLGTDDLAVTGNVGAKGPAAEAFVGLHENQFGAKVGGSLISAEGGVGANVAGVNVGVKGEIGLKAELGFEIGAKGVEVDLPFISLGLTFGEAK